MLGATDPHRAYETGPSFICLTCYAHQSGQFLQYTATEDETLVYQATPETKNHP